MKIHDQNVHLIQILNQKVINKFKLTSVVTNKTKIHESFETVGFDKTLLNPVLTEELINTENMTNYTVPETPFTFEAESINPTVSEEDQHKILGTVNQDTEEDIEFTLELIYPAGYMTKCTLPKVLVDQIEVTCELDEP